jgi:GntR family transcriptional regulator, rspAB operon transcriptional repressor
MAELLRDSVYRALRDAILTCEFPPGQELREQVLAERYHVSRSPIRDSLLRLEQENLVTVLPRQGYRVNPISTRDVEELCGLRLIIAPACAAEAAQADDKAVRSLDQFRYPDRDGSDVSAFLAYNRAFHAAVAELAGNARMAAVEAALIEEFDRLVRVSLQIHHSNSMPEALLEHDAIIDAIQSHDSDTAAQLARDHIAGGQARIRLALGMLGAQHDEQAMAGREASDSG